MLNMNAGKTIFIHILLASVAVGMIFPLLWMALMSMHEHPETYNSFADLVFASYSLTNYIDALQTDDFGRYFLNSIIVGGIVTAGNVVFCLMTGYALARRSFWGKKIIFASVLGVLMLPQQMLMIPLYRIMVQFGWIDSWYALIIPWLVTPFGIFIIRQHIMQLPLDIEDAARMDGAGEWRILFLVVAPLCRPILTVLAIYTFLMNWNSFLYPFLFTNDAQFRTLPVGLAFYIGKQSIDWGHLMAGASISALPILLLFLVFHKRIIEGLTAGSLKE